MEFIKISYNSFVKHLFPIKIRLKSFNYEDNYFYRQEAELLITTPDTFIIFKGTNHYFNDTEPVYYWGIFDNLKQKFFDEIKSNFDFKKNAKSKVDYLNHKINNFKSIEKNIIWLEDIDNLISFCLKKDIIVKEDEKAELDSQIKQEISEFILKLKENIRQVIIRLREIKAGMRTVKKGTKKYDNDTTNKEIIEQDKGEKNIEENSKIRYLTKKEIAKMLGVSTRTIDNYRKKGTLKCNEIGGIVRFNPKDVDEFLRDSHIKGID